MSIVKDLSTEITRLTAQLDGDWYMPQYVREATIKRVNELARKRDIAEITLAQSTSEKKWEW